MRVTTPERREQLLDATIAIMKRDGVERTSLRKVSDEAGASLAAIHVCFSDKEEMMEHAVERFLRSVVAALADDLEALSRGVRRTAIDLMDRYWDTLVDEPQVVLAQLEIGAWAYRHTPRAKLLGLIYERYEEEFASLLGDAARLRGEVLDLPIETVARGLLAIGDGIVLPYLTSPDDAKHRELYDLMIDQLLARAGV